ncbi:MAG TPA: HAMP domain-containing sensor histidine kinase [Kofleriaceae bacterium]|nr:HAMP domain-containing sensor histidine kinase [Kofleriaceae bacterium]
MRSVRSLRGRVALWMFAASSLSMLIFAIAAYVVVRIEESIERADPDVAIAEARRQVLTPLAVAAPIGLALSTAGAMWLSRRALSPVDRVIAAAREITGENLDRRIEVPARDDELRRLVVALNDLLDRIERSHRALAMFAADASHELRTPIAAICSELEIALRRPRSPEEWSQSARTSLAELRRLARVMDSLLRFAQADAAHTAGNEDVELASLVDDVTAMHASAARSAGVELAARCDIDVHVHGDADMLSTAISNLVANAIRYTPRGGSIIATVELNDGAANIHVDDTGRGLAPNELEAIFTPFARGAQGKTADKNGLGLGLPIARKIAERHGGELAAHNRPGGGARFSIRLPLPRPAPRSPS